jgi:tetratricopeptide (TPR) repeat protein
MEGLKKLLSRKARFIPKTQAQALAALAEGIVDESVFVWKAVNIHPVFEEPWDLGEVERLLAKEDLDLETTLLLMTIFERLIRNPDKELALFAAESINAVEQRRSRRIQALRDASSPDLPRQLRELGMICFARPVLKNFYLAEALAALRSANGKDSDRRDDKLEIGILLDLGRLKEARTLIDAALGAHPADSDLHLLSAKESFARRDYRAVACSFQFEGPQTPEGTEQGGEYETIRSFWSGGGTCLD